MRARTGKIARLPSHIRHELCRRLDNGALGSHLIDWLNSLPEVQQVLAERFAGKPVTDDNLSQWRHGGFRDWLQDQERRVRLGELDSQYQQLDPSLRSGHFAAATEERLALELTQELERISALEDSNEHSQQLRRLCRDFCRLQDTRTRARNLLLLETKSVTPSLAPIHDRVAPILTYPNLSGLNTNRGEGVNHRRSRDTRHSTPGSLPINNSLQEP